MPIYALGDREPTIDPDAYVHPDAVVIGDVQLASGVSVWPTAVLRGDTSHVSVGARSNVQDGTVIHCTSREPTIIGAGTSVGHNAHIEGATIGAGCLISSGSVVLNGTVIEDGAVVAAGAVVAPGTRVAARRMVMGVPARERDDYDVPEDFVAAAVAAYVSLARRYRDRLRRLD